MKTDYTKQELIVICERAVVDESRWYNRDSDSAQQGVGKAWAYLRGNVPFKVISTGMMQTNDRTIWLEFYPKDFGYFDAGSGRETVTVYLPTQKRLDAAENGDWY